MKTVSDLDITEFRKYPPLILNKEEYDIILNYFELMCKKSSQSIDMERIKYLLDNFITKEKRPSYKEMGKKFNKTGFTIKCTVHKIYFVIFGLIRYKNIPEYNSYESKAHLFRSFKRLHEKYSRMLKKKLITPLVLKLTYENYLKKENKRIIKCEKCRELFIMFHTYKTSRFVNCLNCKEILTY